MDAGLIFEEYQLCFNTTRPWPDTTKKLILGTYVSILAVLGFLLNLFIILIIGHNYQQFVKSSTIYILLLNCCLSHCCYLPAHFLTSLPGIFSTIPIYSNPLMLWLSSPNTLGYYLVLFSNFSIALDRFLMLFIEIKSPAHAKAINLILVALTWVLSITITVAFAQGQCHKRFNQWTMSFSYGCNLSCANPFLFTVTYDTFLFYFGQCLCFIMFFFYILCFYKLISLHSKRTSTPQKNFKGHFKIIFQFFTIFLAQWATSSCMVIPGSFTGNGFFTTLFSNSSGLVNALANALLLLIFNQSLRKIAQGSMSQIAPSVKVIELRKKTTVISGKNSLFNRNS